MPAPDATMVVTIAVGLLLVAVPARLRSRIEKDRSARIAELESGADERYFEEGRELRAYPSPAAEILRAAGLVLLSLSFARLWIHYAG